MTKQRDPFDLLPEFVDPEPDPAVMQAVIAQSREAFANRRTSSQNQPASLVRWLRQSASWLLPASAGVAALAVALIVAPGLLQTAPGPSPRDQVVADLPNATPPDAPPLSRGNDAPDGGPSTGTRMGMQPAPDIAPTSTGALPQTVSRFEGENVVIGTRLDATGLEIFLPELSGDETIDVQGIMPGEEIQILDAFAESDRDLIGLQFRVDDILFWRIYHLVDGRYGRDPERSQRVSNAPDKAEVKRRLAAE
jgi:hypothetical protein